MATRKRWVFEANKKQPLWFQCLNDANCWLTFVNKMFPIIAYHSSSSLSRKISHMKKKLLWPYQTLLFWASLSYIWLAHYFMLDPMLQKYWNLDVISFLVLCLPAFLLALLLTFSHAGTVSHFLAFCLASFLSLSLPFSFFWSFFYIFVFPCRNTFLWSSTDKQIFQLLILVRKVPNISWCVNYYILMDK